MSTTKELHESTATVGTENSQPTADLPDIDSLPGSDIVIYDGNCNFCKAQVRRLDWFGKQRLSFVSLHDARVGERFPDLSFDELMEQMYVVTPSGERHGGAEAIKYLSRRLPRLWFLAPLMHIPFSLPVWRYLYRQVAKSRYQIAGSCDEEGACKIHLDK